MNKEQLTKLVLSAQEGNEEALNQLFNAYYNDLYYFALKTVKDSELASDITQEAFINIIKNINTLKEPSAFVSWAIKITYFQCTRYFKKKKDILVDEDENGNTVFDNLQEENSEFIPDAALDKDDFKKTVMSIIDELPEEQRATVMMYYFDELSVKQIAEIQGVSEGTVKSRLNYARKAIKSAVEEYEKKNNIKLHAIPFFPFFKWIFEGKFSKEMPLSSAEKIAKGISCAVGKSVSVASTEAVVTTVGIATASGLVAKFLALPLITKIISCIVAVALIVGATIGIFNIVNTENKDGDSTSNNQNLNNENILTENNDIINIDLYVCHSEPQPLKSGGLASFDGRISFADKESENGFAGDVTKERLLNSYIMFAPTNFAYYVPMNGSSNEYYTNFQDLYNSLKDTCILIAEKTNGIKGENFTWEELFSNEYYFNQVGGIIIGGEKYIRVNSIPYEYEESSTNSELYEFSIDENNKVTLLKAKDKDTFLDLWKELYFSGSSNSIDSIIAVHKETNITIRYDATSKETLGAIDEKENRKSENKLK